ncbi:MAG: putative zinc-binding metallopeptidase [Sedimentisphaerales bacterium]|nr:putative zinc-binding metallopeptidase [Sedimentisphaerales bacterium]
MSTGKHPIDWESLSDEELLQLRIKDLGLQIDESPLEPLIKRVYAELEDHGLFFRPSCYLADEWLCPDKEPIIGIPFCLAHRRLKQIEFDMMYEVEGGDEKSCMKLLRHECGHAFNYAYRLFSRTRWRELFGSFSERYSDSYSYQPYSRRYVVHLDNHYAQSHPDEDFAETFAVWLNPGNSWKQKYKGWPAIKKLNYIDSLVSRIGWQPPLVDAGNDPPWSAQRMRSTLAAYYERKRKNLGSDFPGFYDDSLKEVFLMYPKGRKSIKASKLLREHRKQIVDNVARWTGHRKYDLYQLVHRFIIRSNALDLYARADIDTIVAVVSLMTAIAGGTNRVAIRGRL